MSTKNKRQDRRFSGLAIMQASDGVGTLHLDYNEVAADLVDILRENHRVIDPAMFALLEPEQELIAFLLADEYQPELVWNLSNTTLGKGMLLGLLSESIAIYYAHLEAEANGITSSDDDDDQIGDYNDGSSF